MILHNPLKNYEFYLHIIIIFSFLFCSVLFEFLITKADIDLCQFILT